MGIHRHPYRQHQTGDPRQGQHGPRQHRQHADLHQQVGDQRRDGDPAELAIPGHHKQHHARHTEPEGGEARFDILHPQRRANTALFQDLERCGEGAGAQQHGEFLRFRQAANPGDAELVAKGGLDGGDVDHLALGAQLALGIGLVLGEDGRHRLAHMLAAELVHLVATQGVEHDVDLRLAHLAHIGPGIDDVLAGQHWPACHADGLTVAIGDVEVAVSLGLVEGQ